MDPTLHLNISLEIKRQMAGPVTESKVLSIADLGHAHRHAAMLQTLTRPDAAKLGYEAPPAMIAGLVQRGF